MKKLILILLLTLVTLVPLSATENNLAYDFETYQAMTAFSGSAMVSKITDDGINVLFESDSTSFDGQEFNQESIFNIGSVSKLFTTVSILQLQEQGLLSLNDPISLYIDNLSADKQNITIYQLLTHTSGICIDYNMDASPQETITKEDELARINQYDLCYNPGEAYYYNNNGFTLASMIIENVSGESYEDYVHENILNPLHMENTGFPGDDLDRNKTIDGYIDYTDNGDVLDEVYDWRNRGFTSVLSSTEDLSKFAYGIINNIILSEESVNYMATANAVNPERGVGTNILTIGGDIVIGHNGVWDYGNSAVYYRPSDQILFVALTNELVLGYSYPAEDIRDAFFSNYLSTSLDGLEVISTISVTSQMDEEIENIENTNTTEDVVSSREISNITKLIISIVIVIGVLLIRIILKKKHK